jgi:hypothetical protein
MLNGNPGGLDRDTIRNQWTLTGTSWSDIDQAIADGLDTGLYISNGHRVAVAPRYQARAAS